MHLTGKPLRIICAVILLYYFWLQYYSFTIAESLPLSLESILFCLPAFWFGRAFSRTNTILLNDGQPSWFGRAPGDGGDDC